MGLFGCGCCPSLCFRPKPDNVTSLDFSHHCLEDVPHNVFTHERTLEDLYLDSNQIRDLPRALFHCEGLRRLYLSDNELQSIPTAVSSLTKLEELNISKNHILQIPDGIKSCKCLKSVDASINPLGPRLPDGFTQLINLQELYLNDAFLEFLPANFGRLSRLQIVELRENHLKVLPKSMSRLIELRRLDIGQNDFLEFPEVISSLHKLSELWCDCNRIISIPNSIGNLKDLTYLDSSYNKLEEIASDIGQCLALTDLTLTSNNLTELPESIGNLNNLNILRIDENEIKCLPSSIGSLSKLEELVFNDNDIESLPSNIGLLRNLQTLIGDCNRLSDLPVSIGSCMGLRIVSLADNQLKAIPDEMGRLSSLKVLNLNSNSLTYLPISLTKITKLQALWLSENQTKPLIQLQTDIDPESGQKVLTCFLLPQIQLKTTRNSPKSIVSPNESNIANNSMSDKQVIKFSNDCSNLEAMDEDIEDRITTKLIRAPTPYPKELKAHARHARNLALKQKDPKGFNASNCDSLDTSVQMIAAINENDPKMCEIDQNSSHSEVKEAKVSKAPKSPLNGRHRGSIEAAIRPTTLSLNSSISVSNHQKLEKSALNSSNLEFVASKISQLLKSDQNEDKSDLSQKSVHERKGSYKSAVNSTTSCLKSPIERKIKSKIIFSKEDDERGYKSDIELDSSKKLKNNSNTGYSSDCELSSNRVNRLKQCECDSDSALIQKPYKSNLNKEFESVFDCDSHTNRQSIELKTISEANCAATHTSKDSHSLQMQTLTESPLNSKTNLEQNSSKNLETIDKSFANDMNSNSSIGSLCPSSERPVSVCSVRSGSTASANTSANTSHSSLSRNEKTVIEPNSQTPALPSKPSNYAPVGVPAPAIANPRLRPQTASSQFIIHKFSHHSFTQPMIGQNSTSHTVFTSDDIHSKWSTNGINFMDDSNESVDSNGSKGSNSSHGLNNCTNHSSLSNRFLSNSRAHVFPVIIVKNPGLGFGIECGSEFKRPNDSQTDPSGIYVSSVEPAGSASTALKVGDQIIQIDGIDLQNVTKDKANHIFQSTGNTISLMVSRDMS